MQKIAIITAGGSGTRMGSSIPKQFLLLNQKPLLYFTLSAFVEAFHDIQFVLVVPKDYRLAAEQLIKEMNLVQQTKLVVGGETRFHSVQNGIRSITTAGVVFVHDGVRCLVSSDLIKRCYDQTIQMGSAIPAVASIDSVRIVTNQTHEPIDRDRVKIIQTPQTFLSAPLIKAFEQSYQAHFTDEATVMEAAGETVHLIEGEYSNLKITRPNDLIIAHTIISDRLNQTKE
ncbi:MAG: 2-C-methyl-D-erythritol 4-phosphate cytidylyltransferase [Chitinophaga sp.]|nr:2-C-methyl-D-erythritol 4-phosphate cytidylyltransferase [Chitinophaga sp.]PJE47267.1 MAG: 2-C-methyl-D-erythritol 4-phosphate cytidylyltransferase [Sediminibacterium sp.] [Sediminibacterium sp. FEMGT703S]